jgi:hypothetical protein
VEPSDFTTFSIMALPFSLFSSGSEYFAAFYFLLFTFFIWKGAITNIVT